MKDLKLVGMPLPLFIIVSAVVLCGAYLGFIPFGMVGAFAVLMVLGAILGVIGDNTPIVKSFLGGGAIVIIFGSAALVYFDLLPDKVIMMIKVFMESGSIVVGDQLVGFKTGFLDFYIAALITGSILGMSRKLLIDAAIRYIPAILGGVIFALVFVGLAGFITGYGAKEAIVFVGIPIMGGGMGAGAVPIAEVFAPSMGITVKEVLSKLVPAVALGNAVAIVFGGLLNRLGKVKPNMSGNGKLLKMQKNDSLNVEDNKKLDTPVTAYGTGILLSTAFMILGVILSKIFPIGVHFYAWMIISVGIVKGFGLMPRNIELAAQKWYQFVAGNFTLALLAGIGIAYTDLGEVINAFSLLYLLLVIITVVGAVVGTMLIGRILGFYEIEVAITAGLCMANMGGTGDVAVLSASDRMELMPFAQISSRIGGTIIILLATAIASILF